MFVSLEEGDFFSQSVDCRAGPASQWEEKRLAAVGADRLPAPLRAQKSQKQPVRGLRGPYGHKEENREAPGREAKPLL